MRNWNWLGMCCVVGLGACSEDVGSGAIRTRGIYAAYTALATGNGSTEVTAQLRVGGDNGTIVKLEAPDRLIASVGDEEQTLAAIDDRERYREVFASDEGATPLAVAFERGDVDDDAPDSSNVLPEPFSPSLDQDEDDVERGTAVPLTWEPAGTGTMQWSIAGDCIFSASGTTSDDGSFMLPASEVDVTLLDEGESCDVTVTLSRVSLGSVDAAFEEGGRFEAIQRRTLSFTSTPAPSEFPEPADAGM